MEIAMTDVQYSEPIYADEHEDVSVPSCMQIRAQDDPEYYRWHLWLKNNLLLEREHFADVLDDVLEHRLAEIEAKHRELELALAKCTGALDVVGSGKVLRMRGAFSPDTDIYREFDVVMLDGSSFVAVEDRPGPCPGDGWRLLCSAGRRGQRGVPGPRGPQGEPGEPAPAVQGFKGFHVDGKNYTISLITSDGQIHSLNLRALFEQFVSDMGAGHGR
jgi:hypothetical protein